MTSTNTSVPILFTGDVDGNFNYVFKKIRNVLAKTKTDKPFSMLICCGNFFGDNIKAWEEYTSGEQVVPIQTFILGPVNKEQIQFYPKMESCDIVQNLTYLGKYGVYTTGEGLRIAYMSGVEGTKQRDCTFTLNDIEKLISSCTSPEGEIQVVDILVSYQWPYNITSSMQDPYTPHSPSRLLGHLINKLRPQYHIATCEKKSFERAPFPHFDENGTLLSYTRFVGLAAMDNATKSKSIYALRIQRPIMESVIEPLPREDTSPNPFSYLTDEFDSSYSVNPIFFSTPSQSSKRCGSANTEERIRKKKKFGEQHTPCWFCLSNRTVDKYLIISVASECYLALAKGGVVDNHSLITTIAHFASANRLSDVAADEVVQFKMSLRQYFRGLKMEIIFYERAYKSTHLQIHCIPLAANLFKHFKTALMAVGTKIEEKTRARKENLELQEYPNGTMIYRTLPSDCQYFYIDLPNDNEILIRITDDDFPLSFGRDIIAQNILNVPERSDWRKCVLDEEIAKAIVNDFRAGYQQYDFT